MVLGILRSYGAVEISNDQLPVGLLASFDTLLAVWNGLRSISTGWFYDSLNGVHPETAARYWKPRPFVFQVGDPTYKRRYYTQKKKKRMIVPIYHRGYKHWRGDIDSVGLHSYWYGIENDYIEARDPAMYMRGNTARMLDFGVEYNYQVGFWTDDQMDEDSSE
jgi:hypothetical protein